MTDDELDEFPRPLPDPLKLALRRQRLDELRQRPGPPAELAPALLELGEETDEDLGGLVDYRAELVAFRSELFRCAHDDLGLSWSDVGDIFGVTRSYAHRIATAGE